MKTIEPTALNISQLTEHLFRKEAGKMVSILTNIFGPSNLQLAEDVVQDTLLQAFKTWKLKGIPDNPEAWLYRAAKNKAIDKLRKNKHSDVFDFSSSERQLLKSEYTMATQMQNYWKEEAIEDQQLRMMYICCNPSLNPESQIALILKTLCGFSTSEIAKAFLCSEDTISKRLYRSKTFFRKQKTSFELPEKSELASRTTKVLNAIYLLFNEGYNASHHENLIRQDLVQNALMLGKMICDNPLTTNTKSKALVALMCFHAARENSRLDATGEIVLLEEQDRNLWNKELIGLGVQYLNSASTGESISSYHLEAAIAYEHCSAVDIQSTNWLLILKYYDMLYVNGKSPIVALNRAVVYEQIHGSKRALKEIQKANKAGALEEYYLYHSLLGNLYKSLKENKKAEQAYTKAISLTNSQTEKNKLKSYLEGLE